MKYGGNVKIGVHTCMYSCIPYCCREKDKSPKYWWKGITCTVGAWLLLRVFHSYLPYFCFAWYVRVVQMVAMTEAVIKVVKEIFLGKQARMRARMRSEM